MCVAAEYITFVDADELSPAHICWNFELYTEHCCIYANNINSQKGRYTVYTVNGAYRGLCKENA